MSLKDKLSMVLRLCNTKDTIIRHTNRDVKEAIYT